MQVTRVRVANKVKRSLQQRNEQLRAKASEQEHGRTEGKLSQAGLELETSTSSQLDCSRLGIAVAGRFKVRAELAALSALSRHFWEREVGIYLTLLGNNEIMVAQEGNFPSAATLVITGLWDL